MQEKNTNKRKEKWGVARPFIHGFCLVFKTLGKMLSVFFKTLFITAIAGMFLLLIAGVVWVYPKYQGYNTEAKKVVSASTPKDFQRGEASYIYDKDGNLLARLCGDEDSEYLSYEEIPTAAVEAFIAIEDRTFWENSGYDLKGIIRVGVDFIRSKGKEKHGASTITQQLARGVYLTREVSLERKAKEILIAMELTKKYSKENIMEYYCNYINFANTYYGLQAAAKGYFSKDVSDLSLSEIAYLCAIPNSPTYYNPYTHPENAIKRRDKILEDMLECGYITVAEYELAVSQTITIQKPEYPFYNYETSYAIECATRELMKQKGFSFQTGIQNQEELEAYQKAYQNAYEKARNSLYQGGYQIYTTLDLEKQAILQQTVDENLTFDSEVSGNGTYALQGSVTAIDNLSGKVVAIVGGRTQETNMQTFNRAFQGFRQPGSTFKPILVYGPALEQGFTPDSIVENINVTAAKEKNADILALTGDPMPMRQALEKSRNGAAYWLYARITPQTGMEYLRKMRFEELSPDDYGMSACLGGLTNGVTTEEMAAAYRMIANHGIYQETTCIDKMIDKNGNLVNGYTDEVQVFHEDVADTLLDMMKGVLIRGTAADIGWKSKTEAAGKTGTTNNSKDGWFCGVTPYYTVSVWVGYDTPRQLSSLYGATYPAKIWKRSMEGLIDGLEPKKFDEAAPLIQRGESNEFLAQQYLPGRDDNEVLSDGYTVRNYREDHYLADQARNALSAGNIAEASELIDQIYGRTLRGQMNAELDSYSQDH